MHVAHSTAAIIAGWLVFAPTGYVYARAGMKVPWFVASVAVGILVAIFIVPLIVAVK